MATTIRRVCVISVVAGLWSACASAQASLPIVSHTGSGTATVQLNGVASPVTDSDATTDPLDPGIFVNAQYEDSATLLPHIVAQGQVLVQLGSGLRLSQSGFVGMTYFVPGSTSPGGTGSASVTSDMEFDLPSDSVIVYLALPLSTGEFTRTRHARVENMTDQEVLLDADSGDEHQLNISGQEGDRVRILVEATLSGVAAPGSPYMHGSVHPIVDVVNAEDCNGNGQSDDQEVRQGWGFDCNDNLILDGCDIATATSFDCNGNGIPDECEADCNGNGVHDACDISAETSADCDETGVPDECEAPQPDCNDNGIGDGCDLADGTSTDCNTDGIPDDCQPDEDCDDNGVRDLCDIGAGTSADCNLNLALDSCDTASGASPDTNGDSIPDECQSPPQKGSDDKCLGGPMANQPCAEPFDCPGGFCYLKNRFITAEILPTVHGIKVTLVDIDVNSVQTPANYNGTDRWVGAPTLGVNDGVSPPFNAAKTQCSFLLNNWSGVGRLHIYGDVIRPRSLYDLRGCNPQSTCSTQALRIATAKFGDVVVPLNVVNFQDVNAELAKFQGLPSGPSKTRAKLWHSVLNPNTLIGFSEISAAVAAFQSRSFKSLITTPPATCP